MTYAVCYIDDRLLPIGADVSNETDIISNEAISDLISLDEWEEHSVRKFLTDSLKQSNKFKQIELSGFTHPSFFLNHVHSSKYDPNIIVLDWDYGGYKAEENIIEILEATRSKIFILTGNELESDIDLVLEPIKSQYSDRGLNIFSKSIYEEKKKTQENLIEEILDNYINISQEHTYYNIKLKFYPSFILPDFDSFWMIESILGSNFIRTFLAENGNNISQKSLEKMFENSNISFYVNSKNTRIYSENGLALSELYGEKDKVHRINAIYAVKNYDLAILETASEKGISQIFHSNEK